MINVPNERPANRIPSTNVTNEIVRALAGVNVMRTGMVGEEQIYPDTVALLKITGNASGGGKYYARKLTGSSTAVPTGDLSMPEGMTVPSADDVLFLNLAEDGASGHRLTTGAFISACRTGTVTGTGGADDGKAIYEGRVGPGVGDMIHVSLSDDGSGSAGDQTHAPSFKYNVTDDGGNSIGTSLSPTWPRPLGKVTGAATEGMGHYNSSGTFVLDVAFETRDVAGCTTP